MIVYSQKSLVQLATCHPDLQHLFKAYANEAPPEYDISLICGHRGEAAQNKAYADKASKLQWPDSDHNAIPADALDFHVYPLTDADWKNPYRFWMVQGRLRELAARLKIKLKPPIPWDAPHVGRLITDHCGVAEQGAGRCRQLDIVDASG